MKYESQFDFYLTCTVLFGFFAILIIVFVGLTVDIVSNCLKDKKADTSILSQQYKVLLGVHDDGKGNVLIYPADNSFQNGGSGAMYSSLFSREKQWGDKFPNRKKSVAFRQVISRFNVTANTDIPINIIIHYELLPENTPDEEKK